MTLLQLVQDVLVAMGGDEVNSVSDTPESEDIVRIARTVLNDIQTWDEWEHERKVISLDDPEDPDNHPVTLMIPGEARYIEELKYKTDDGYVKLDYLRPDQFIEYTDTFYGDDNTKSSTGNGVMNTEVFYKDNADPQVYTCFDNQYVYFDSYDSSVHDTIVAKNVRCFGYTFANFVSSDEFIIPIPRAMEPLYFNQVKVACMFYMNQAADQLAAKETLRQLSKLRSYDSRVIDEKEENYPHGRYSRFPTGAFRSKMGRR